MQFLQFVHIKSTERLPSLNMNPSHPFTEMKYLRGIKNKNKKKERKELQRLEMIFCAGMEA